MGRAAYHSGADVYLGANEAANLVGAWRQLGSDVQISTPGVAPRHHHHHHREGRGRGAWAPPAQAPYYQRPAAYVPPVPYAPPAPLAPQSWNMGGGAQVTPTVRDHRAAAWNSAHPGIPFVGVEALMGAVSELAQSGPTPRAWLRDMPPPDMANRQVLPMNTGTTPVPQNSTAQITSRPQRVAFRPERVFVSDGIANSATGIPGSAADWIINDITIGNRSQFAQSGALPGDMFSNIAIDSFVTFETAQTAMDVVMIVTYQGAIEGGTPFYGSIIGTAAV